MSSAGQKILRTPFLHVLASSALDAQQQAERVLLAVPSCDDRAGNSPGAEAGSSLQTAVVLKSSAKASKPTESSSLVA